MIVDYIEYRIPEEKTTAFEAAFSAAEVLLRRSPHCLKYEIGRSLSDNGIYVIRLELGSRKEDATRFDEGPENAKVEEILAEFKDLRLRRHRVSLIGEGWEKP